jgi:hypothetical protein
MRYNILRESNINMLFLGIENESYVLGICLLLCVMPTPDWTEVPYFMNIIHSFIQSVSHSLVLSFIHKCTHMRFQF